MRRKLAILLGFVLALLPAPASAGPTAGSAGYGDPPGWCTRYSDMWTATVVTNDPLVATNPERDTFYGFHANPGYDDWFGFFYGDFRGSAGDASGWVKLLHELYPDHYSWNFADNGWAVHGHVKQYIAYYNWTFGGQCGLGRYGSLSAPPFMADQYGWPVVDVYVDAKPPFAPSPRVVAVTPVSVSFTWDPVADQGDGAGSDYFEAGVDHYGSWVTVDGGPPRQSMSSSAPRLVTESVLPGQTACLHVQATDRVQNATPEQVICANALAAPPMPQWQVRPATVAANPSPLGLVGFDSWLWLEPLPRRMTVTESYQGTTYRISADPAGATWDFGDGATAAYAGTSGFGDAFPARSAVTHTFQAHDRAGYSIRAAVRYLVSWNALVGSSWVGPYPMGTVMLSASTLAYPVEQAQPELLRLGT